MNPTRLTILLFLSLSPLYIDAYYYKELNDIELDSEAVYHGLLDPNNIAIHVGQNFINFFAGKWSNFQKLLLYFNILTCNCPHD